MEPLHNPTQIQPSADISMESGSPAIDTHAKERHQRLFQRGLKWLCMGVSLMAVSFGVNFILFHSDSSFVAIMYVLTTAGAACILKGLVDVLGF